MNGDLRFRTDVQSKYPDVYTPEAIAALGKLEAFCQRRQALMRKRLLRRSERISNKQLIEFLPPDSLIGESGITVQQARDGKFVGSTIPADLKRQWVQGTGPATRPHSSLQAGLRNPAYALLSGADGWMFDGEDALGQIGTMSLDNQRNIRLAVSRDPQFLDVAQSVAKEMNAWAKGFLGHEVIKDVASQLDKTTVIFRPRGLHLDDRHVGDAHGNGLPASIVDAVLYVVNNYKVLQSRGSSIVLYLPKIQTAEEASLWNDMLAALETHLKLAVGTIKTYVLVEQLEASYQLMEIRAALGLHFVGFNTGRWDYINSVCDALSWKEDFVHPNIDAIVLTYGYMRHYENRVLRAVNTPDAKGNCALWQGGMEANIPVGSEKGVAEGMKRALAGARREQQAGASGKWVAHWKMVHSVRAVWEDIGADNQLGKNCERLTYTAEDAAKLIELEPAPRTVQGARALLSVGLQYGNAFLRGFQAAALKPADFFNNDDVLYLMEDMATGEIRLSILWEWVHKEAKMTDTGEVFTVEMFNKLWIEEYAKLLLAPNKDVHDDSKETTLPIARLIVRTYVRNRVKPCWYVDLLNINIDNDDLAVARARISRYLAAFNGQGERLVENLDHGTHPIKGTSDEFDKEIASVKEWCSSPRFSGIKRLHSTRQIVEQRGKIHGDYGVARSAAHNFFNLLRKKFASKSTITTFGPYSPGQGVTIKRAGIEAIYLGGWATSAKGSKDEDPGPDLASYPLSQVPNEAAAIVRALLTADKNQRYHRMKLNAEAREATPAVDFQPFIIADADTGHGGDAHVRNLIRRFVEVGVPGYHIEDQRPGVKKCGHQAGKVLVPVEEQIRRLNTARFQLDVMEVPGIIVARTDSEAATYLDSAHDERDHPFILGATNPNVPSYKTAYVTILKHLHDCGLTEVRGHHLFRHTDREHTETFKWLQEHGLIDYIKAQIQSYLNSSHPDFDQLFDAITNQYAKVWFVEARLETLGQAVADALRRARQDGDQLDMKIDEWTQFCQQASIPEMHRAAAAMGHPIYWDPELSRTPEGFYQVQGGLEYAIHRSLAVASFADILWMETKTADLDDAKQFADAIHAVYPDKMLAYNLSPSFNWDTTGMNDEQMRAFPGELAKLGYVFNFITYGGHQIDGLAAEEFCSSLKEEGMLALARLQRKLRLIESPYRTPQSLVGGPRIDAALMASTGRSAATKAMGKGSTHFQHLIQTELPTSLLDEWLAIWREQHHISTRLHANIRPHTPGSDTLVLNIVDQSGNKAANVIFNIIHDRRGRSILSIRDENNFDPALRQKRLLTLLHVFLIQRYGTLQVYYVSPNEYNLKQAEAMVGLKLYTEVRTEVGDLIVADVNTATLTKLFTKDKQDLMHLIRKEALSV